MLRLLENEQVTPEEVETALHDGLEYYLEESTEPDFQQVSMRSLIHAHDACTKLCRTELHPFSGWSASFTWLGQGAALLGTNLCLMSANSQSRSWLVCGQDDNDLYAPLPLSEVDENIGKIVPPAEKKGAAADGSEVLHPTTLSDSQ